MYIIMEYIENGSLRTLLRKCGNLPELLACTYLEQVLFGLQYLHHQGVIHRDIKSANLLVSTDGTIKVTDFGVSTRYELTSKGTSDVAGTPNWSLPSFSPKQHNTAMQRSYACHLRSGTGDHPDAAADHCLRHLESWHHHYRFVFSLSLSLSSSSQTRTLTGNVEEQSC